VLLPVLVVRVVWCTKGRDAVGESVGLLLPGSRFVEFAGGGRAGEGTPMRRVRSLDLFSGREREGADIPDDEARVASDLIESYGLLRRGLQRWGTYGDQEKHCKFKPLIDCIQHKQRFATEPQPPFSN